MENYQKLEKIGEGKVTQAGLASSIREALRTRLTRVPDFKVPMALSTKPATSPTQVELSHSRRSVLKPKMKASPAQPFAKSPC